jgi:hypothetical protein
VKRGWLKYRWHLIKDPSMRSITFFHQHNPCSRMESQSLKNKCKHSDFSILRKTWIQNSYRKRYKRWLWSYRRRKWRWTDTSSSIRYKSVICLIWRRSAMMISAKLMNIMRESKTEKMIKFEVKPSSFLKNS